MPLSPRIPVISASLPVRFSMKMEICLTLIPHSL
jgi:hypothetical protein